MAWICCSRVNLLDCVITVTGIRFDSDAGNCYIIDGRAWGADSTNNSYCYFRGAGSSYSPNTFDFGSSSDSMRVYVNGEQIERNQVLNYADINEIRLEGFNANCNLKNLFGRYAATSASRESLQGSFEKISFDWGEGDPRNFVIFGKVNADFALQPQQLPCETSYENDVFTGAEGGSDWLKSGSTYTALVSGAELSITGSLQSPIIEVDVTVDAGDSIAITYAEYTGNAYSTSLSEIALTVGENKKLVHLGQVAAAKIVATNVGDSFTVNSVKEIQRGLIMGDGSLWQQSEIVTE